MAKKSEIQTSDGGRKFIDKTGQHWYNRAGTNQVIFCDSIDTLISGEHESIEFTEKLISKKIVKKDDKEVERNGFMLFLLTDGSVILAHRFSELK
jgi:hypothetical protein